MKEQKTESSGQHRPSMVCAEIDHITSIYCSSFLLNLTHTPRLIRLYRLKAACTGKVAEALHDVLQLYDLLGEHDVNIKHTVALRALPVYLREEGTQFFKTWNMEESDEPDVTNTPVAILTVVMETSTSPIHFSPASTAIVVEDELIMTDISRCAEAFALLLGLIYALHLDYPKNLIHTLTFIQKVLMGLDDGLPLKPCLLSLKNDLLMT